MEERNRDKEVPDNKNITPVTTAKILPVSGIRKIRAWLHGSTDGSILGNIMVDVVVPAGKELLSKTFDMLIYRGEGRPDKRRPNGSRVQYDGYFDRPYSSTASYGSAPKRDTSYNSYMGNSALDYDNIYVETRVKAIEALSKLDELLNRYHIVTVSDLYVVVNMKPAHTANKYGWTDLSTADFVSTRDGYLLKLPRAMPID